MLLDTSRGESPRALLLTVKVPWTGVELSKEVEVEYTVPAEHSQEENAIGVRWTPERGGMYPSFEGTLRVLPGRHSYSSTFELVGHYTPPLGVLGIGFDAAIGHRVAEATMKYLLEGLVAGVLARERTQEWQAFVSESHRGAETPSHVHVIKGTCVIERPMLPPPTPR
jgi:hypothetical protein